MSNETAIKADELPFDVEIGDIEYSDRLRDIEPAHAMLIAVSMRERGQLTPILVRRRPGKKGQPYILVAGGHRIEGANLNGWTKIKAVLFTGTEAEARLAEIDENLIRHELSAFDRATFMAERKRLYEEIHPDAKHGGDRRSAEYQNDTVTVWSFAKDTAERCGLTSRTIERAVQIATKLAPAAKARIPGTWLAKKQGELIALSHLTPEQQLQALDLLLSPEPSVKSVEAARKVVQGVRDQVKPEAEKQFDKLADAWDRAGAPARRNFVEFLRKAGALDQPQLEQVA